MENNCLLQFPLKAVGLAQARTCQPGWINKTPEIVRVSLGVTVSLSFAYITTRVGSISGAAC